MDDKIEITKSLMGLRKKLKVILDGFDKLDSGDNRTNRLAVNQISFTLFEVVDELTNTEIKIYNFLKRRGDNELLTREKTKS